MDNKPVMGVAPAWLVAWERIGVLADAIKRNQASPKGDPFLCSKWAKEIEMQCDIIKADMFGGD